jgi:hypothetical protein
MLWVGASFLLSSKPEMGGSSELLETEREDLVAFLRAL